MYDSTMTTPLSSYDTAYRWANSDGHKTQLMETGHVYLWTPVRMDLGHVVDAARALARDLGFDNDEISVYTVDGYGYDITVKGPS